jgi:hypothetical protein
MRAGAIPTKKTARHHSGTERVADGPGALHQRKRLGAVLCGPYLRDQRGAGGPLAAHAEAKNDAAEHKFGGCSGEAAERGGNGVDQHAGGEGAGAAKAVGEPAEADAARGCREQRGGHHGPAHGCREMHGALHLTEHERVEHHVHAVEHPAETSGEQGTLLLLRGIYQPTENAVQERSRCVTSIVKTE